MLIILCTKAGDLVLMDVLAEMLRDTVTVSDGDVLAGSNVNVFAVMAAFEFVVPGS